MMVRIVLVHNLGVTVEFRAPRDAPAADHAAVDCDYHELFGNALEYIERALGIYQKEGNLERYDILTLGLCQKIAANALTKLGRYDEAEERLEKAEEILLEWSNMHENAGRTVTRNYFMGECNDIRDEIRRRRENEGKNTTQKTIFHHFKTSIVAQFHHLQRELFQ